MITITLDFSMDEAKAFFESAGLEVKPLPVAVSYSETNKADILDLWVVVNPHNSKLESLYTSFVRCVSKNKENLISEIGKAEIFNSFEKK